MTLHECERKAQDQGFDRCLFVGHFPAGVRMCRWLDAYMGAIIVMDLGLVHTCQLEELFPNLECNAFEVCTAEEANERVPVD